MATFMKVRDRDSGLQMSTPENINSSDTSLFTAEKKKILSR